MFFRLTMLAALAASVLLGQGYQGPSILSRGENPVGVRGGEQVDLRFFANVDGIYDTGYLPVSTDTSGNVAKPGALAGVEVRIGAYGVHNWRRAQLGLDYKGNYRHYTENSYFDGTDQALSLYYGYQKSRRLGVELRGTAASYSNSLFGNTLAYSGGSVGPGQLLFDNRATFLQTGMDLTFAPTRRTVFTAGGEGFDVLRQSSALVGVHGYTLRGGIERKLSQYTSLGIFYDHTHYDYPKAFGESNMDSFTAGITKSFHRNRVIVRVVAGGVQVQTEGVQTIQLDPLVASILGVSTGVEAFYSKVLLPRIEAGISYKLRTSRLSADFKEGVNPGNGVYLTSQESVAQVNYDYAGRGRFSGGVGGGWSRYSSLGQTLGLYNQYFGQANLSYKISRSFHAVASYQSRRQTIDLSTFAVNSSRVQIGLAYSPGDIPLSFH